MEKPKKRLTNNTAAPAEQISSSIETKVDLRKRGELRPPMGIVAASICGVIAAVMYTAANIALRSCVDVDSFLVSAAKAAPTVILLGPMLIWMRLRGEPIVTSRRMIPRFIAVSLLAQIFGNVAFQVALGIVGLAASVPITLGVLIIGGAIFGWMILGEPVNRVKIISMVILITAVIVLSLPNSEAQASLPKSSYSMWIGALAAAASGAAYALFGVSMRQTLTGGVSAVATMFISGVVGTIALWCITIGWIGLEPIHAASSRQWVMMATAGVCNLTAFAALSASLKSLPVVAVNLINASQVAMAAVAGVILFAEPVTAFLVLGIALTIVGLLILAKGRS